MEFEGRKKFRLCCHGRKRYPLEKRTNLKNEVQNEHSIQGIFWLRKRCRFNDDKTAKKGECLVLHGEETSILQLRSHFLLIVTSRTCSLVGLFVCLFCFVLFFCFRVSLSYKHANVASQSNLFTLALKREKNTAS